MKIKDFISRSIQTYPTLYKCDNYYNSKLKVLNQIFFTIGNGYEVAETKIPEEGGYVVEEKYKRNKKTDDYIRIKDKPYGKEKYKELPTDYFDTIIYKVSSLKSPIEVINNGEDNVYYRYDKDIEDCEDFYKPKLRKIISNYPFIPYPFSKNYSLICDMYYKNEFMQQDWIDESIILCKETLKYFLNEELYKKNSYYPTEKSIKSDLNQFQESFNQGKKEGKKLRKIWGYKVSDICPDIEEITIRKWESWADFHKRQIDFLNKFLSKFDKNFSSDIFYNENFVKIEKKELLKEEIQKKEIQKKEIYTKYQTASKQLFKKVFGDEMYEKFEKTTLKEIDWNGIDINSKEILSIMPNIKDRFKKEFFNNRNYSMLDLYITSILNYGYQNKINDSDYADYQSESKELLKQLFGKNIYNQIIKTPMKEIIWYGYDITVNEIIKCVPNIHNRFKQSSLDYSKDRDETMLDIYIMSVFHYGYQDKCERM